MENDSLIEHTKEFVKFTLKGAEGGHDWFHTLRVYNNAMNIAKGEDVDHEVVALAALLHDIADSKFHDGDETLGPRIAREYLFSQNVDSVIIEHVVRIIENCSFNLSLSGEQDFESMELRVIQDADRLDAIGAIGIARCFNYGGFKNRAIFNPDISPRQDLSKEDYKKGDNPSINHFYEKLLLLKDKMHTKTARKIAESRHKFMESYLQQFYAEWDGKR